MYRETNTQIDDKKILIGIGGGPRVLAIAAANKAMEECGLSKVRVEIVEPAAFGANWRGANGYTDGSFPLDTSPLKDLTFPGRTGYGPQADRPLAEFSFIEHLKDRGSFERWVNGGSPGISHAAFAEYLTWAAEKTGVRTHRATVQSMRLVGHQVEITAQSTEARGATDLMLADGVVLSGPGDPRRVAIQDEDGDRIFDSQTYWPARRRIADAGVVRVAVIGGGQSAGTAAMSLLLANPKSMVEVINSFGFLPLQSTGQHENALCSNGAEDWTSIPLEDRHQIMNRINNGVIERSVKAFLDAQPNLRVIRGRAAKLESDGRKAYLTLSGGSVREYDFVVVAIGFDPTATLQRLMPDLQDPAWLADLRENAALDHHLRLPGLPANLHVPALAGLAQGPGLGLLSCLGTVAVRVLSTYVTPQPGARASNPQFEVTHV